MKKVLLFALVLLLAIPALSFAGSATSRWDLTIGGYVKVDAGYANQAAGAIEQYYADRNNAFGNQNVSNAAGSFGMATGTSTLNFLVKGPDTWGAKTTAFIQGNFAAQTSNAGYAGTRYGTFTLTHAYMDFTWANTKLMVGQNWQLWGFMPSYNFLGMFDFQTAGKGNTVPQITVTQNFGKNFYASLGVQEPYNMKDNLGQSAYAGQAQAPVGTSNATATSFNAGQNTTSARVVSEIPDVVSEIGYKSDACGVIGPNMMQFGVGGFWGQDKVIFLTPAASNKGTSTYGTNTVNRWASAFKFFIPVIPEKNLNKAGALSLSGSIWTGQNLANFFLGARDIVSTIPYNESSQALTSTQRNYGVPVTTGGWGQISYYFTDKVYFNGLFGYLDNLVSNYYKNQYNNQVKMNQQYIGNIFYDVNPAVRVALEYSFIRTYYNGYGLGFAGNGSTYLSQLTTNAASGGTYTGTALGTYGSLQTIRLAFFYFF